jgi:ATP-dependent DNA ligase
MGSFWPQPSQWTLLTADSIPNVTNQCRFPGVQDALESIVSLSPTEHIPSPKCPTDSASRNVFRKDHAKMKSVPLPRFDTMPLAVLAEPFDHPDWLFEVKYDGFRALAYIELGRTRLVSRKGNAYKSFNILCGAIGETLRVRNAILDGEIVHLEAAGKPQFYSLLHRRSPQQLVPLTSSGSTGRI